MRGSSRYISKGMTEDVIVGDWSFRPWQPMCVCCERQILNNSKIMHHPVTKEVLCPDCLTDVQQYIEYARMLDELDRQRSMGVNPPRAIEDAILYGLDDERMDYWD